MIAPLIALLIVPAPALVGASFEVEPKPLPWSELSPAKFDLAWSVPETRTGSGPDLVEELRALLALRFEAEVDGITFRAFGDVAQAARGLDDDTRSALIDRLIGQAAELAGHERAMRELLLEEKINSSRWDPDDGEKDDGLYLVDSWILGEEPGSPWSDLDDDARVEQGAAIVWGDLAAYKAAENDFTEYPSHVGSSYESIRPVRGSYYRGVDESGEPFAKISIDHHADLPWPFGSYKCRVHSLTRVGEKGDVLTDVYSTSSDFHWLAGRDVFLELRTSADEPVAILVVRLYGFDLDGVPDGTSDRRAALRSSLGNLKLSAERRFRERGGEMPPEPLAIPEFQVLGPE